MYFFPFSTMALMVLRIVLFGTEERIFHWKYSRFIQYFVANALWIKEVLIYSMQSSMYVCAVFRRNNFWIPTTKKRTKITQPKYRNGIWKLSVYLRWRINMNWKDERNWYLIEWNGERDRHHRNTNKKRNVITNEPNIKK